jgi:E3 ubiquitin-protein ligase DOA10
MRRELDTHTNNERRRLVFASFVATMLGGLVSGSILWAELPAWALAAGLVTTVCLIALVSHTSGQFLFMIGFAVAFALVTWLLLVFLVGYARYLITGEALGE